MRGPKFATGLQERRAKGWNEHGRRGEGRTPVGGSHLTTRVRACVREKEESKGDDGSREEKESGGSVRRQRCGKSSVGGAHELMPIGLTGVATGVA
jgi:hypothetical protein